MEVDLFGNIIAREEEVNTKTNIPTPFSYANNVANKTYPDSLEGFNTFLFNTMYSQRKETIFYSNEMNKNIDFSERMVFDFYFHSLPKKSFFSKWAKGIKEEYLLYVKGYYNCSDKVAKEYIKVLTKEELEKIKQWEESKTGGK